MRAVIAQRIAQRGKRGRITAIAVGVGQAKYQRVFTVYVNDREVYDERAADSLVAELFALGTTAGIESISKLDTNPANSPQPPRGTQHSGNS